MSVITDLFDRHLHYCCGDVCEIAMNDGVIAGINKVVDEIEDELPDYCKSKRDPAVRSLLKIYNDNYSTLCKALIQCCSERPMEFRDVDFIAYLTSKYTYFKKLRNTIVTQSDMLRKQAEINNTQQGG